MTEPVLFSNYDMLFFSLWISVSSPWNSVQFYFMENHRETAQRATERIFINNSD
jgi:hypothetical protein